MKTVTTYPVLRCEVSLISNEFSKILEDLPELSSVEEVRVGKKRVEGAKKILVCQSSEEALKILPELIKKNAEPQHSHVRIVEIMGYCPICKKKDGLGTPTKPCPHVNQLKTVNRGNTIAISDIC